ncbi:tumor necrosis factor receptor superfamily member 27 isoform X2 [Brachyhypopomus gauderio]|uniref:tumor necrosis factor receptor superfamily member 27 isoform X2 n=1 Tax=Brachyhypopomus gauderio TaxID=698409 RepID=UPI0040438586
MNCGPDEYSLNEQCHKCLQCPPGQELKEDCGYGLGVSATCGVCERRWFKTDWGSHACRMCQNCRRLSRHELTSCTYTHNAGCGDCLPGFYSKRRLDGSQDLECLPCGPAYFTNVQCRIDGGEEKILSSEAPSHNATVMMTTCVAAVTMVTFLFVIVVLMHQGFGSLKKLLRGCLSPPSSHSDPAAASVSVTTEHTMTREGGGASELCQPSTFHCKVSMPTTSDPSPHVCESPSLRHGSICSDPTARVVTQATGLPTIPPASERPLHLSSTEALAARGRYCAGEQEEGCGLHAPVECTELEYLNLSFPPSRPVGQNPLPTQRASGLCCPTPGPEGRPDLLALTGVEQHTKQERHLGRGEEERGEREERRGGEREERGGCRGGRESQPERETGTAAVQIFLTAVSP